MAQRMREAEQVNAVVQEEEEELAAGPMLIDKLEVRAFVII